MLLVDCFILDDLTADNIFFTLDVIPTSPMSVSDIHPHSLFSCFTTKSFSINRDRKIDDETSPYSQCMFHRTCENICCMGESSRTAFFVALSFHNFSRVTVPSQSIEKSLNNLFENFRKVIFSIAGILISFFDFVSLPSFALDQAQLEGNSHCPA